MDTVGNIYQTLCKIAPLELKMDFDNVGFLIGCSENKVSKVLVSLDITNDVITEALDCNAELIVSHHPLFFSLKSVNDTDIIGAKIIRLISGGISAICMHTNLDAAQGGTNDALAAAAGISNESGTIKLLCEDGQLPDGTSFSYGRVGFLEKPYPLQEYLKFLKKNLRTSGIRYYDSGKDVYHLAVVSGSGGSELQHVFRNGCDTFVTSDIKYDVFLEAKEIGINLIDGDHFCTENLVTDTLVERLGKAFPEVKVSASQVHSQTIKFY